MSDSKWVSETVAEDDNYNWILVNEDDEGFRFFIVHLADHSLELMMPEEGLEALYELLKQIFEGSDMVK